VYAQAVEAPLSVLQNKHFQLQNALRSAQNNLHIQTFLKMNCIDRGGLAEIKPGCGLVPGVLVAGG
jgi:hypothetical protein